MNLEQAKAHLLQEPHIATLVQRIELPHRPPSGAVYFDLLESIVSQQLSVKAATTIHNRFLELFPDKYPHPAQVLALPDEAMRAVGLSGQKLRYIKNVAEFARDNEWTDEKWHHMADDEIIAHLTQIKGVGKWTVQMVLMFTLGRPDVFPVDDLGIQQGVAYLFELQEEGKALKARMEVLSEPWKPYRTLACKYLWRYKDNKGMLPTNE
jgi:DNA-3-methyladenine glycosylase II